ncbi:hypothetical protein [Williamsia sp. DF01-3]|uniref:hypothetical protein n=1 Tax=Williamsia sp. DF01-3 TaxID=2934157 RepID=UPI001FF24EBB|nr:hypothetical protein [Williamsia sp. DF01-3]MCK0517906.1 hypothetical protein [Williamsia sp. DF01-3]
MTLTLSESVEITGKSVFDYLDHEAEVPQVDRVAAQGDVLLLRVTTQPAETAMAKTVVAVASEASANTHTLHPNGPCFWEPHTARDAGDVLLGKLTVPDGSTALVSHQEHGNLEVLPGTYEVRRQREFAGEWAYVAD